MIEMPLEVTFARLYKSMADWRPSTNRNVASCRSCLASQFSQAFALEHLPHDVTHLFLLQLEALASRRLKELEDEFDAAESVIDEGWFETIEDRAERSRRFAEQIDEETWTELARRTP